MFSGIWNLPHYGDFNLRNGKLPICFSKFGCCFCEFFDMHFSLDSPRRPHTHPMLACTREAYTHMRKKQTAYLIFSCDFSCILFVHLLFHFPSEKSLILFCFNVYGLIRKKTKRAPKVEVGTGTTDASLDEWLQVCSFCIIIIIHESFPTVLSFHSFHDLHFYFVIFLSFLLLARSEDENLFCLLGTKVRFNYHEIIAENEMRTIVAGILFFSLLFTVQGTAYTQSLSSKSKKKK